MINKKHNLLFSILIIISRLLLPIFLLIFFFALVQITSESTFWNDGKIVLISIILFLVTMSIAYVEQMSRKTFFKACKVENKAGANKIYKNWIILWFLVFIPLASIFSEIYFLKIQKQLT